MFTGQGKDGFFLLIRSIVENNYTKFINKDADFENLANRYFSAKEGEFSIYRVNNQSEEAKVMAAHWTCSKNSCVKKILAVRISEEIIKNEGMSIKKTLGSTGIKFADNCHYDVTGTDKEIVNLLKKIRILALEGKDVFRVCDPAVIANIIKGFLSFGKEDIKDYALKNCQKALSSNFKHLLNCS